MAWASTRAVCECGRVGVLGSGLGSSLTPVFLLRCLSVLRQAIATETYRTTDTELRSMPGHRAVIAWRNIQENRDYISANKRDIRGYRDYVAFRGTWVKALRHFGKGDYSSAANSFSVCLRSLPFYRAALTEPT